jgi:hypothetical protein
MPDRLTPNPYSPYADADPQYRHLVPGLFGIAPPEGVLTIAACGLMTVVPGGDLGDATDALIDHRFDDLPEGLCPRCIGVATGREGEISGAPTTCEECGTTTRHARWCALCRQELHDQWWPNREQTTTPTATTT